MVVVCGTSGDELRLAGSRSELFPLLVPAAAAAAAAAAAFSFNSLACFSNSGSTA